MWSLPTAPPSQESGPIPSVAVAAVSRAAAEAGAAVARPGGNAVDAALAAALASVVTHPGMCSLGGGAFLTIWPVGGRPVTVDGGLEMPGRGLPPEAFGEGALRVEMEYAGGVSTLGGAGSVATPGLLAGCSLASERYGRLAWRDLLRGARELVADGFPLPAACHAFLRHAHRSLYGHDPRSRAALHDEEGKLLPPGARVRVEGLPETLALLAEEGAGVLYEGELGKRVVAHVRDRGGILTREDLAAYEPAVHRPLRCETGDWTLATNPPPAVGGAVLAALLALTGEPRAEGEVRGAAEVGRLVRAQRAVLEYRQRVLDGSEDRPHDVAILLEEAASGDPDRVRALAETRAVRPDGEEPPGGGGTSASTLHVSAVDADGTACSITLSDGYGSGVMPPGTGLWLNNCLGEAELNPRGYHALEPGTRLTSNMAPTVARRPAGAPGDRRGGRTLAIGTPGSERIPVVLHQVLTARLREGAGLREAVERPRLHVAWSDGNGADARVVAEPGVSLGAVELPVTVLGERAMYFGGVAAAEVRGRREEARFEAAADPRRTGGTAVGAARAGGASRG